MQNPSFNDIEKLDQILSKIRIEYWLHHILFTPQWWFLMVILIVPWFIFVKLIDKNRIIEVFLFGALASITIVTLDDFGVELQLWTYKYRISFIQRMNPVDYTLLPISYMLIYQYCKTWKFFILALVCLSFAGAFIVEPLFVWFDIYQMLKWKSIYSIPFYILIPISIRWFVTLLKKKQISN
jgi:hypothetical protein